MKKSTNIYKYLSVLGSFCLSFSIFSPDVSAQVNKKDTYLLDVELDPVSKTVFGTVNIHWKNQSSMPLTELIFHLYLNAFEHSETVFMKETEAKLRGDHFKGEGSIEIISIRINTLPYSVSRIDDGLVQNDRTQMKVVLPFFLMPEEAVSIEIDFISHLPPIFARSGFVDNFFAITQWFPKLAKLENDGTWVSFPYHGFGEFYADFADYEARVKAPKDFQIASSGEEVSQINISPDFSIWELKAQNVHDFAWAAWPKFKVFNQIINSTNVKIYLEKQDEIAVDLGYEILELSLEFLEKHFGKYPYPTLSIVIPPKQAWGASGMEYPTFFFGSPVFNQSWLSMFDDWVITMIHELVHQWFQGMVATNEVEHPWLDEGVSTWVSFEILRNIESKISNPFFFQFGNGVFEMLEHPQKECAFGKPAYEYQSDEQYFQNNYDCPALFFEKIAHKYGREQVLNALENYANENRFKHPKPEQLFEAFDKEFWAGFSNEYLFPGSKD